MFLNFFIIKASEFTNRASKLDSEERHCLICITFYLKSLLKVIAYETHITKKLNILSNIHLKGERKKPNFIQVVFKIPNVKSLKIFFQ